VDTWFLLKKQTQASSLKCQELLTVEEVRSVLLALQRTKAVLLVSKGEVVSPMAGVA
jgi:hypothetical protein